MYKVKINYCLEQWPSAPDKVICTELPKIPNVNDCIGFWDEKDWVVGKINDLVYELDENNKFLLVELNVYF